MYCCLVQGDCLDQFMSDQAVLLKKQRMEDFKASSCPDEKQLTLLDYIQKILEG